MTQGILLGGPKAWKVRAVGDLVLAYHWVNDEPTMFIYPRYRRMMLTMVVPWGLPLQGAHELVHTDTKGTGVNTEELLAKATRCASLIGFGSDARAVMKIADLILSGLDDLIRMPPTPDELLKPDIKPADGTMKVVENGKVIIEREV